MILNLNRKPNHFNLYLFLAFSSALFAYNPVKSQTQAPIYSETYFSTIDSYEKYKDSLPFYLFPYGIGGALMNEGQLEEDVMKARAYTINFPVIITSVSDNPFKLWSQALLYQDTVTLNAPTAKRKTETPKMSKEDKIAYEKSQRVLSPEEIEQEKAIAEKEELYAERVKKEKQSPNTSPTEKNSKSTEKQKEQNAKPAEQKDKPVEQKKNEISQPTIQILPSAFSQLPDSIKTMVELKGMEKGLMWLYQQQIIAGNALFCDVDSKMPVAILNSGSQSDFALYAQVLNLWKNEYKSIWKNSTLEAHLPFKENKDMSAIVGQIGKNSMVKNRDFTMQIKAYINQKSQIN